LNADLISPEIKDPLRCAAVLCLNWLDYIYTMQYVISVTATVVVIWNEKGWYF